MKKLVIISGLLMFVGVFAFGQTGQKATKSSDNSLYSYSNAVDVAYETSFPMGNLSKGSAASWVGTTARYEFNLGSGFDGMITSGYLSFATSNQQSYSAIPVMVGAKYHFVAGWYGMVETGVHFFSSSGPTAYNNPTEWGFSVGTGYEIPLSNLLSIDLATKYQYNTDNLSYWNARAGLMFKF